MTAAQRWQVAAALLVVPLAFFALPGPARQSKLAPGEAVELFPGAGTLTSSEPAVPQGPTIAAPDVSTDASTAPGTQAAPSDAVGPTEVAQPDVATPAQAEATRIQSIGGPQTLSLSDPGAASPWFAASSTVAMSAPTVVPDASAGVTSITTSTTSTILATPTPSTTPTPLATPTTLTTQLTQVTPTTVASVPSTIVPTTTSTPVRGGGLSPTTVAGQTRTEGVLVRGTTRAPVRSDGVGAFRTFCAPSHVAPDDPIVAPGRPGGSHLHSFFGNDGTNADSTADSIAHSGGSTCRGGIANRSAYWSPSIIDTTTGAVIEPAFVIAYYKSGYLGVSPDEIAALPAGLRIIAGDARATSPDESPSWSRPLNWNCGEDSAGTGTAFSTGMQRCAPGQFTRMTISFPQCWNGRDLDAGDHRSHMAWPDSDAGGCPATHPVAIPQITLNFYWPTPAGGNATWRLSSDMYVGGQAGWSGHADWWNGWDPTVSEVWVERCVRAGLDCSVELLGDGNELIGTF